MTSPRFYAVRGIAKSKDLKWCPDRALDRRVMLLLSNDMHIIVEKSGLFATIQAKGLLFAEFFPDKSDPG